jgi:hypothetical protein
MGRMGVRDGRQLSHTLIRRISPIRPILRDLVSRTLEIGREVKELEARFAQSHSAASSNAPVGSTSAGFGATRAYLAQ